MIHYMKRAYFTRVFDNIGFKCKIICHLKISAFRGIWQRGVTCLRATHRQRGDFMVHVNSILRLLTKFQEIERE